MISRLVTLAVGSTTAAESSDAYRLLADIGADLTLVHEYVSVNANTYDITDSDSGEEYYDDETVKKVYRSIKAVLPHDKLDAHELANDVLLSLQNAGILFRERR